MHGRPLLLPATFCWWMITQFCAITMMVVLGSFSAVKVRQGVFDLKLLVKFNLLLIVVFGLGLFVIAYQARSFLQEQAQAEVLRQAGLMAASASSHSELHRTLHHAHHREDDRAHNNLPAAGNSFLCIDHYL